MVGLLLFGMHMQYDGCFSYKRSWAFIQGTGSHLSYIPGKSCPLCAPTHLAPPVVNGCMHMIKTKCYCCQVARMDIQCNITGSHTKIRLSSWINRGYFTIKT